MAPRTSTVEGIEPSPARERRDRRLRSLALGLLVAFVGAGALGGFGVREAVATRRSRSGLSVEVRYPAVARPGLAVPLQVQVRRPSGFDGQIDLRITTSYLQAFDENGASPDAASGSSDERWTSWTFDPPDGDVLTVWFDTRVEPGVQWRRPGTVVVETGDEQLVVEVTTWIAP